MVWDKKKQFALILVIALVANMILFGMGQIDGLFFWVFLGVVFVIAKYYYPKK
tara:strand:- start:39 stop:197 length:159 start_codon:yes stop_codon:yes gene_type:complete